jgi:hypothetical protein
MAGTNRPNGSAGAYNVTNASSAKVEAPNKQKAGMKGTVVTGGDLRARGGKKK